MKKPRSDSNYEDLIGDSSVKYADTPTAEKLHLHVHDAHEVTLILSDNVELTVNNVSYPVPYGSLLLFNTMDAHQIKYNGSVSYKRYVVWFKNGFLSEFEALSHRLLRCFYLRSAEKPNLLSLSGDLLSEAVGFYERLKEISESDIFMKAERFKLTLAQFLISVNDWYLKESKESISLHNREYASVYKAITYLQENYSNGIKRKTLAAHTGLTERTLCGYFKSVTGLTTNRYILEFRLSVAKSLLLKDIQTTDVAEKTGFDNYSNFSRTFKKHVGSSPKQYALKFSAAGAENSTLKTNKNGRTEQ